MRRITFYLSLIMVFTIPWQETVVIPGLGTASRLIGLLAAGFWVLSVLLTYKMRKVSLFHVLMLIFFAWNIASIIWSFNSSESFEKAIIYVRMAGMVMLIWDTYETPADIKSALHAYLFGAFIPIGSIIYNFIIGNEAVYGRFSAAGNNANNSSLMISLGMPIAWYLASSLAKSDRTKLLRLIDYIYVPLGLTAIALTATRFAMIVSIPACIYGLGTLGQVKLLPRIIVVVVIAYGTFILGSVIPESSFIRLAETDDSIRSGDLTGRVAIWQNAFELWTTNSLLGIGTGVFKSVSDSGRSAHNTYIGAAVETGLIGLALLVMTVLICLFYVPNLPRSDATFWMVQLLVWGTCSMVLYMTSSKVTWLFLSLLVTHVRITSMVESPPAGLVISRVRRINSRMRSDNMVYSQS